MRKLLEECRRRLIRTRLHHPRARLLIPKHALATARHLAAGRRAIALHGGLGDVILMAPYILEWIERLPDPRRALLVFEDVARGAVDARTFSEAATRRMRNEHGGEINPISEFLTALVPESQVRGGDTMAPGLEYWFPPRLQRRAHPFLRPAEYRQAVFSRLFRGGELEWAREWRRRQGVSDRPLVMVHFRRSAEQLVALYDRILNDPELSDVHFVAVGSRDHEVLPTLKSRTIDLTDNYAKGVSLLQVLALMSVSDAYLGGRGGFELFAWCAGVPAVNIFDQGGLDQLDGFWPSSLWEDNPIPELFVQRNFDSAEVARRYLKPLLRSPLR